MRCRCLPLSQSRDSVCSGETAGAWPAGGVGGTGRMWMCHILSYFTIGRTCYLSVQGCSSPGFHSTGNSCVV